MRPLVTLKLATSLDGKIATGGGESRWITGPEARLETHRLRAAHDAVLVGIGTALADDPELTVRLPGVALNAQPLRVVLDSALRLPPTARLAQTLDVGPVLAIGAAGADGAALQAAGVQVAHVPATAAGHVDATAALGVLSTLGVARLFVEGGGRIAAALLAIGVVDRLEWFRAPLVLGAEGRPAVGSLGIEKLAHALPWRRLDARAVGVDLWERYERQD